MYSQVVADEMSTFVGREASIAEALAIIGASDDPPTQPQYQLSPSASASSFFVTLPAIVEVNKDDEGLRSTNDDGGYDGGNTSPGGQRPTAVVSGGYGPDGDEEHYDGADDDEWDEDMAGYFLESQRGVGGAGSDSEAAANLSSVRGVTLGVVGRRGSGKSAFMARLAKALFEMEGTPPSLLPRSTSSSDAAALATEGASSPSNETKNNTNRNSNNNSSQQRIGQPPQAPPFPSYRPVVVRFCGLTRSSSSGLALVRSLCRYTTIAYIPVLRPPFNHHNC